MSYPMKNKSNICRFVEKKSQELNTFFGHLHRAGGENRVQNRDFSEKPRWGPYKNHKNVTKYRSTLCNC